MGRRRDHDAIWQPVRLHAACNVHRVAPDVVDELVGADHSGHYLAGMDADAHLQWDGKLASGARIYELQAYRNAFLVLPGLYLIGLVLVWRVRETWCRPYGAPAPAAAPIPARA